MRTIPHNGTSAVETEETEVQEVDSAPDIEVNPLGVLNGCNQSLVELLEPLLRDASSRKRLITAVNFLKGYKPPAEGEEETEPTPGEDWLAMALGLLEQRQEATQQVLRAAIKGGRL